MVENMQEVIDYMSTNAEVQEVKDYVGGFVTSDRVNSYLEGEDGKKLLQPKLDVYATKSIKTHDEKFRTNELPSIIDAKVKELYPDVDVKDTEINKMKAMIEDMKKETTHKELTNAAMKIANEKKLPIGIIDFFVGCDEPSTIANLEKLEEIFGKHIEQMVSERLKSTGTKMVNGSTVTNQDSYEDILKNADSMTSEQVAQAFAKLKETKK